jgi:hypothetical protein
VAESRGYSTRKWSKLDNYKCDAPECIYDSFDEEDVKRHIAAVHASSAPRVPGPGPSAHGRTVGSAANKDDD